MMGRWVVEEVWGWGKGQGEGRRGRGARRAGMGGVEAAGSGGRVDKIF